MEIHYSEMRSVGAPQDDTIGLPGTGIVGLCICGWW